MRKTPSEAYQGLVEQRKCRPVSPHLSNYGFTINYILSPLHRISGLLFSGTFYIFGTVYLVSPLFGWHLDVESIVTTVASWPVVVKTTAKFAIALPFTFHSIGGLRHLLWDTGRYLTNRQIIRSGWIVIGTSLVGSLYLATMF